MSMARRVTGWVLVVVIGAALVMSAVMKIIGHPSVVEVMSKWDLETWRVAIGVVELISAILLIVPRTHSLGLLLVTAYLGGAIATHLQQGEALESISPAIMLALLWIAGLLRHSEMLISFWRRPVEKSAS